MSNQIEMPKGIHDCLFLLRRTDRNLALSRPSIVVSSLLDTNLVFYLPNVKGGNLQSMLLLNVRLDLRISRGS